MPGGRGKPREQKKAYKAAMQCFQDDYHFEVGVRFGLTRIGPRLQRLYACLNGRSGSAKRECWPKRIPASKTIIPALKSRHANSAGKVAATDAAADPEIHDVMDASRHVITTLKHEANRRMSILQDKRAALMDRLEEKDGVITAQAEEIAQMRELLAQHKS